RYAGDEFVAVISGDAGSYRREIAQRICRSVDDEPIDTVAGPVATSLSVGIATSTEATLAQLLHEADAALFRAKRAGRNKGFRAPPVSRETEITPARRP